MRPHQGAFTQYSVFAVGLEPDNQFLSVNIKAFRHERGQFVDVQTFAVGIICDIALRSMHAAPFYVATLIAHIQGYLTVVIDSHFALTTGTFHGSDLHRFSVFML